MRRLRVAALAAAAAVVVALAVAGGRPNLLPQTSGSSLLQATAATADTHYPPNWRQRLLALVGAPRTVENLRLLNAWGIAEGGTAKWNALNTTYPLPFGESWSYNGSSVQNYWRPTGGVAAVALTIIDSRYAGILGDLQTGTYTGEQIVQRNRPQFQTWGTNPDVILRVLAS